MNNKRGNNDSSLNHNGEIPKCNISHTNNNSNTFMREQIPDLRPIESVSTPDLLHPIGPVTLPDFHPIESVTISDKTSQNDVICISDEEDVQSINDDCQNSM